MKIAVVGSGVSGLAATWLLNEHSDHTVHLYEADSRPGGHAHTVHYTPPGRAPNEGKGVDVDTGFIVFNPTTYPNFLRFLRMHPSTRALVAPTEMTLSVSRDNGAFEWAGKDLWSVFCQPRNLLVPGMWRLVWDVLRFNACAGRFLSEEHVDGLSIGEYLDREGYSSSFRDNYLIPMTAAIWSTPLDRCMMDFPARTLIQFLHNHHLLQITGKPSWMTIRGGSKAYVNQILSSLPASQLHLSTKVESLTNIPAANPTTDAIPQNHNTKVLLRTSTGESETYDHVILACHSDAALRILQAGGRPHEGTTARQQGGITSEEEEILSAFEWSKNEVVLHSDTRLMPKSRLAWSCWNCLTYSSVDKEGRRKENGDAVSLTYGMNDLQHIPESKYGPVLVTLNPPFEPQDDLVAGRWNYDHPILDEKAVRAQRQIHRIQNTRGISYAGAYLRYGFHEDGFTSGLAAAAALSSKSVRLPFLIKYVDPEVEWTAFRLVLVSLFRLVEGLGIRALVGLIGDGLLGVLRWTIGS